MEFVRSFKDLSNKDTKIAGGKGASLAEMINNGFPIPGGFVVLSGAFDEFVEETDLGTELNAMWNRLGISSVDEIEKESEMIQKLILGKKFPKDLEQEVSVAFGNLNAEYVAVRSSATAEDSSLDAWAGQLDSYLYVDKDGLLENIQKCWASLFTPRAIFYRLERKIGRDVSVAVVVQKMAKSDVSGVCFTVHPVTKDRDQMIIEACWGLGEALVQGIITPDSYVVKKSTMEIVDINIGCQEKQIVKAEKETVEKPVPEDLKEKQKLSEAHIKELAKICIDIENHYGNPRDIEWALEGDKMYIVQSRPITTL